jgi:hypothetical protein
MPIAMFATPTVFAAGKPTGLWAIFFLPLCLVVWLLLRGLLRSEKAEGFVQPVLWFFAGTGVVGVVIGGIVLAVREYSRYGLRASQHGLVLLVLLGMLAVAGGLLWVARTTEGSRILAMAWLFYRVVPVILVVSLFLVYVLFGPPRHR